MKECFKKIWLWLKRYFLILFLFLVSSVAFLDLMSWFWSSKFFDEVKNGIQNLLLLLAFEAAFYYAYVTHKMWQIDKDPVLRLQWHDIGTTDQAPFKKYREIMHDPNEKQDKKDTISYIYNSFTDLQLVNNGKGAARDLRVTTQYKGPSRVKDSQNLPHKIKFESDEHYNDGFRIV